MTEDSKTEEMTSICLTVLTVIGPWSEQWPTLHEHFPCPTKKSVICNYVTHFCLQFKLDGKDYLQS